MLSDMKNGQRVVTKNGHILYSDAPATERMIHLPISNRRNYKLFDHSWHDMTPDTMDNLFESSSQESDLLVGSAGTGELDRMMQEWQHMPLAWCCRRRRSTRERARAWSWWWISTGR